MRLSELLRLMCVCIYIYIHIYIYIYIYNIYIYIYTQQPGFAVEITINTKSCVQQEITVVVNFVLYVHDINCLSVVIDCMHAAFDFMMISMFRYFLCVVVECPDLLLMFSLLYHCKSSPHKRLAMYSVSFLSSLQTAVKGSSLHCFFLRSGATLEVAGQQIWLWPYNMQL